MRFFKRCVSVVLIAALSHSHISFVHGAQVHPIAPLAPAAAARPGQTEISAAFRIIGDPVADTAEARRGRLDALYNGIFVAGMPERDRAAKSEKFTYTKSVSRDFVRSYIDYQTHPSFKVLLFSVPVVYALYGLVSTVVFSAGISVGGIKSSKNFYNVFLTSTLALFVVLAYVKEHGLPGWVVGYKPGWGADKAIIAHKWKPKLTDNERIEYVIEALALSLTTKDVIFKEEIEEKLHNLFLHSGAWREIGDKLSLLP